MKIIWKKLIKKIIEFESSKQVGQNQIQLMARIAWITTNTN
jgi:hypothetical protein